MLTVEGILALHHAHLRPLAQRTGRLHQRCGHLEVGHGGVLDGRILPAGVLEADGAGGHHHVAGADIQIDAAAGTHPDKGVGADIVQLLHGDGGRRAADAGGADGDLLPQQGAGVDGVLPILGHEVCVVKQGGDFFAAAGVAGQDHIPAHVALHTVDMKLLLQFLHEKCLLSFFHGTLFDYTSFCGTAQPFCP